MALRKLFKKVAISFFLIALMLVLSSCASAPQIRTNDYNVATDLSQKALLHIPYYIPGLDGGPDYTGVVRISKYDDEEVRDWISTYETNFIAVLPPGKHSFVVEYRLNNGIGDVLETGKGIEISHDFIAGHFYDMTLLLGEIDSCLKDGKSYVCPAQPDVTITDITNHPEFRTSGYWPKWVKTLKANAAQVNNKKAQ
jgi:hypothetical protein